MKRAKPPKRKVDKVESRLIVEMTNQLNFAALIRTLVTCYDWNREQVDEFIEAYLALIEEIYDQRETVPQFIRATEEMTGVNVKTLISEVMNNECK